MQRFFICPSSHVSNTEVSDQKPESSNLGSNLSMSSESKYLRVFLLLVSFLISFSGLTILLHQVLALSPPSNLLPILTISCKVKVSCGANKALMPLFVWPIVCRYHLLSTSVLLSPNLLLVTAMSYLPRVLFFFREGLC